MNKRSWPLSGVEPVSLNLTQSQQEKKKKQTNKKNQTCNPSVSQITTF